MNSARVRYLALMLVMLLVAGGVLACDLGMDGEPSKPTITMTMPTSGAEFEVGEEVNILSSASDAKGVSRVELYVDGQLYRTDPSPDPTRSTQVTITQAWLAEDPGSHTLSVVAVNVDGEESDPWAVTIRVTGDTASPAPSPTPEGGPPPTATSTVEPTASAPTATPLPPTPTVNPDAPIIKYFRANGQKDSYTAIPGETVVLSWEWAQVDAGYMDPGNVAMVCPSMPCTFIVVPPGTTTYTLKAINSVATTKASVTVEISAE